MFRIWGKIMKNSRFLQDTVIEINNPGMSREDKINECIDQCCIAFDLERPMWFEKNTKDMIQFSRTCFYDDQFIETIAFDYFEIEIIEEDKEK